MLKNIASGVFMVIYCTLLFGVYLSAAIYALMVADASTFNIIVALLLPTPLDWFWVLFVMGA